MKEKPKVCSQEDVTEVMKPMVRVGSSAPPTRRSSSWARPLVVSSRSGLRSMQQFVAQTGAVSAIRSVFAWGHNSIAPISAPAAAICSALAGGRRNRIGPARFPADRTTWTPFRLDIDRSFRSKAALRASAARLACLKQSWHQKNHQKHQGRLNCERKHEPPICQQLRQSIGCFLGPSAMQH